MRLYGNRENGRWVGTKAEAKKEFGFNYSPQDVPTDKASLITFLNVLALERPSNNEARITGTATATHQSSTPVTLFEAAKGASLRDLQHGVYRYLERIDDEFDLRRTGKE